MNLPHETNTLFSHLDTPDCGNEHQGDSQQLRFSLKIFEKDQSEQSKGTRWNINQDIKQVLCFPFSISVNNFSILLNSEASFVVGSVLVPDLLKPLSMTSGYVIIC